MSTLRIKFGSIELEYEGELAFEKADIFGLLDALSNLAPPAVQPPSNNPGNNTVQHIGGDTERFVSVGSVSDVAQRLDVKTGPDMVKAAAAALHFISKKVEFTTKDIAATMRDAKAYFKASYASNLGASLTRLVKADDLRSLGGDRYALSAKTIEDLKSRLAQT